MSNLVKYTLQDGVATLAMDDGKAGGGGSAMDEELADAKDTVNFTLNFLLQPAA